MIFNHKTEQEQELPKWSIKKQKAYRISRILWKAQIIIALIASIVIVVKFIL